MCLWHGRRLHKRLLWPAVVLQCLLEVMLTALLHELIWLAGGASMASGMHQARTCGMLFPCGPLRQAPTVAQFTGGHWNPVL